VLDRAYERGLDVGVIFWRPNPEATYVDEGWTGSGSEADRDMLDRQAARAWPVPGFPDTKLGVLMEPEAGHGTETAVHAGVQA
jgi:hypothetical protein